MRAAHREWQLRAWSVRGDGAMLTRARLDCVISMRRAHQPSAGASAARMRAVTQDFLPERDRCAVVSPFFARVLFTVRAAISSAFSSDRPRSS